MTKIYKNLIIIWIVIIAVAGIVGYWQKPEQEASAAFAGQCGQFGRPIPIGEVLDGTVDVMDQVFQIYQAQVNNLNLAIESITEIIALTSNPSNNGEVCDFSKCQAQVGNRGPTIRLEIEPSLMIPPFGLELSGWPPMCKPQECTGQPCPDLSPFVYTGRRNFVGLGVLKDTFGSSANLLNDWFKDKTELITNDIAKADAGQFLTKVDFIKRKIELTRVWLTPYLGIGQRTCVANESDRKLIDRGELDPIEILSCSDIILGSESGYYYWPQAPKECQSPFEETISGPELTAECSAWLAGNCSPLNRAISWTADITCQLFKEQPNGCLEECAKKQTFDYACNQCLCERFGDGEEADGACMAWLCGGSSLNFVCCRDETIGDVAPVDRIVSKQTLRSNFDLCYVKKEIINWQTQKGHASAPLVEFLNCIDNNYQVWDTNQNKCNWQITSISDSEETESTIKNCIPSQYDTFGKCTHKKGSAHYGGTKNNKICGGFSYAVDIRSAMVDRDKFDNAIAVCQNKTKFSGKVSVVDETNPVHIHINVGQVDNCI